MGVGDGVGETVGLGDGVGGTWRRAVAGVAANAVSVSVARASRRRIEVATSARDGAFERVDQAARRELLGHDVR